MWMMKYLRAIVQYGRAIDFFSRENAHEQHDEGEGGEAKLEPVGALQQLVQAARDGVRLAS